MGTLTITYQAPGQRPLSVATVEDEALLWQAAHIAIEQAEQRAAAVAVEDPVMGMLQAAEVRRLQSALEIIVRGFSKQSNQVESVQ
jgi:hypothetical protein